MLGLSEQSLGLLVGVIDLYWRHADKSVNRRHSVIFRPGPGSSASFPEVGFQRRLETVVSDVNKIRVIIIINRTVAKATTRTQNVISAVVLHHEHHTLTPKP